MKEILKKYNGMIKLVIAFIIFYFSGYFISIPLKLMGIKYAGDENLMYLLTFAANVLRAVLMVLLFFKDLKKEFKPFKKNFWEYSDITVKYWLIGLSIMAISNVLINSFTPTKMASNEEDVRAMITAIPLMSLIMTTITAPLTEELLFRKSFKNIFKNDLLFIIVSGVFFGSLHVVSADINTVYDFLYIIPYSALGITFAATCAKTNNIYPTIIMHSIHNCAITLVTIIVTQIGMII